MLFLPKRPNNPNGELQVSIRDLVDNFNHFSELTMRPEPKNHSVLPSLVEIKVSAVPTWTSDNKLAVALYPSVAFWNPYNVPIEMSEIFVDIPMNLDVRAFNSKEWDLFRKWYIHNPNSTSYYIPHHITTSSSSLPTQNWSVPGGTHPYIDTNGNGRWDPGEPRTLIPRPPRPRPGGGGGGGGGVVQQNHFPFQRSWLINRNFNMRDIRHPQKRMPYGNFRWLQGNAVQYGGFPPDPPPWVGGNGVVPAYRIFLSHDQENLNPSGPSPNERHLLLKISGFELAPGEKSHFVVNQDATWEWAGISNSIPVDYITVDLSKGDEGFANTLICKTGFSMTPSEPLTARFWFGSVQGVNRKAKEDFDHSTGNRVQSTSYLKPQGITVYGNDPRSNSLANLDIIKKINRKFPLNFGSGHLDFSQASVLSNTINSHSSDALVGSGFRLRWKFPGTANSVVFNQYNPRALVDSLQEGYGNNWEIERFDGMHFQRKSQFHQRLRFFNFYVQPPLGDTLDPATHFTTAASARPGFETEISVDAIVPKAGISNSSGFFHEQMQIGSSMGHSENAVLFDLPRSPLLSIAQFKHANLNNYSHGPAYIVGNSYATPQVGRYKTWARVRALRAQPKGNMDIVGQKNTFNFRVSIPGLGPTSIRLFPWQSNWNSEYGAIRDDDAINDHQNLTLDHSYYANQALFDGFFLSGVENLNDFSQISSELEPGERFRPFRNPRLIPYLRENSFQNDTWEITKYDQKDTVKIDDSQNKDLQYQTLAADLLIDGAFNINSTSVDAWVAQLTSLKIYPYLALPIHLAKLHSPVFSMRVMTVHGTKYVP